MLFKNHKNYLTCEMVINELQCSSLLLNSRSISCVWDDNSKICVTYKASNDHDNNKLRINILIVSIISTVFLLLVLMFIIVVIYIAKKKLNTEKKRDSNKIMKMEKIIYIRKKKEINK
jgi:fucose permease